MSVILKGEGIWVNENILLVTIVLENENLRKEWKYFNQLEFHHVILSKAWVRFPFLHQ